MYRQYNDFVNYPNFDFIDKELHLIHSAGGSYRIRGLAANILTGRIQVFLVTVSLGCGRLFEKAIKNNLKYLTINDRVYLEYMGIYAEFFSLLK
jgi:hypothetical protein